MRGAWYFSLPYAFGRLWTVKGAPTGRKAWCAVEVGAGSLGGPGGQSPLGSELGDQARSRQPWGGTGERRTGLSWIASVSAQSAQTQSAELNGLVSERLHLDHPAYHLVAGLL